MDLIQRVKQAVLKRKSILKEGNADRVIFYSPADTSHATYLDGPYVRVYKNGIVDVQHTQEHVTSHIQNVEIIWRENWSKEKVSDIKDALIVYQFDNHR